MRESNRKSPLLRNASGGERGGGGEGMTGGRRGRSWQHITHEMTVTTVGTM